MSENDTRHHVLVERIEWSGETIAIGRGRDEGGRWVTFTGDWRPMLVLDEHLRTTGEPEWIEIEPWQIIARLN